MASSREAEGRKAEEDEEKEKKKRRRKRKGKGSGGRSARRSQAHVGRFSLRWIAIWDRLGRKKRFSRRQHSVMGKEEGAVMSIPGNEGRISQAWVNVRGSLHLFSVNFWHSEGWTPRTEALLEAVVKQAKDTRHLV